MEKFAVLALDVQNGFITPQNQNLVFKAADVLEAANDAGLPLLITTVDMLVPPNEPIDMFIWHSWQSHEASMLLDPVAGLLEYSKNAMHVQRQNENAFTSAVAVFLKQHQITDLVIVGVDHDQALMLTVSDAQEQGFKVHLIQDALDADLDSLPANMKNDATILAAQSFIERSN